MAASGGDSSDDSLSDSYSESSQANSEQSTANSGNSSDISMSLSSDDEELVVGGRPTHGTKTRRAATAVRTRGGKVRVRGGARGGRLGGLGTRRVSSTAYRQGWSDARNFAPRISPLLPGPLEMLAITVICQYWTYSSYSSQPKQILNEKWINNEY